MKKIVSLIALFVLVVPAFAATGESVARGGRSVAAQMAQARRGLATTPVTPVVPVVDVNVQQPQPDVPAKPMPPVVNNRDQERDACLNNNIGVGNTFVWASRYSNTSNYASMVEDVEEPANNACFVKVEIKSNDPKVNLNDIPSRYFEMGQSITCGDWTDADALKQRILDSKKTARTWGTVGGAVGGAGIGVGIMELFGNRAIGGKVQGQEALAGVDLLKSQMLVVKDKEPAVYNDLVRNACEFIRACNDKVWQAEPKPTECAGKANATEYQDLGADAYEDLMDLLGESCDA